MLLARVSTCIAVDVATICSLLAVVLLMPIKQISTAQLGLGAGLWSNLPSPLLVFNFERFYIPPILIPVRFSLVIKAYIFRKFVSYVLIMHIFLITSIRPVAAVFSLVSPCADRAENINRLVT